MQVCYKVLNYWLWDNDIEHIYHELHAFIKYLEVELLICGTGGSKWEHIYIYILFVINPLCI